MPYLEEARRGRIEYICKEKALRKSHPGHEEMWLCAEEKKKKEKNRAEAEKKRFPKAVRGLSPADLTPPSTFTPRRTILDIIQKYPINKNTIFPSQCLSSSVAPPRCPRQRRSLPQRPKSRWSRTCSTGALNCNTHTFERENADFME